MPSPRAHREIASRRRVALIMGVIPPALNAAVLAQPARVPSPRADLRKNARRRVALPVVVHAPADSLTTLAHGAGMRRPRAHLRENALGSVSTPEAAASPASNLARRSQPAGMQIPCADRAELPLWRIRLSVVEHIPPKTAGTPALDRAAHLAHRTGKVPAHRHIHERAVRRVRIPTPADNPAIPPPNRAAVPLPRANRRVAPLRNFKQLRRPIPPAVNPPVVAQRASVIAPGIKRDIAANRRGGESVGNAKSQKREQQRGKRPEERFTPPPPDRVRAAATRRACKATAKEPAIRVTPATLHQRAEFAPAPGVIPSSHARTEVRIMTLSPQARRRADRALTSGHQTLTGVAAKLTKAEHSLTTLTTSDHLQPPRPDREPAPTNR